MLSEIFYSCKTSDLFNSGICSSPSEIIRVELDKNITIYDCIFGKDKIISISDDTRNGYYKMRITTPGGCIDFISKDITKLKSIISFFPELKDSI